MNPYRYGILCTVIMLLTAALLMSTMQVEQTHAERPPDPHPPFQKRDSDAIPNDTIVYTVVEFSQESYLTHESNIHVPVTVTLDAPSPLTVTVHYQTADGTATAGEDYLATSGILTFTPGTTDQSFNVTILEDTHCEMWESIHLALSDLSQGTFTLGLYKNAEILITNDDPCFTHLPLALRSTPPPPIVDRLLNPGFENITTTHKTIYGEDPTIQTPEHWITWWEHNEALGMYRPETRLIPAEWPYTGDPVRIRSGYRAMMIFRSWSVYRAGFLQRIDELPPGAEATFCIHAHAWACENDPPPALSCNGPVAFHFKVGIDPTGGTDPLSPNVIWSEKAYIYDIFGVVGPVTATVGEAGAVTVFTHAEPTWPLKFVDAYLDDAALIIQPR